MLNRRGLDLALALLGLAFHWAVILVAVVIDLDYGFPVFIEV